MYWSKNKERRFIKIYPYASDEEIAKIMKVSVEFVKRKAEELGLEKQLGIREWTQEEVEYLKMMYPSTPNDELAKALSASKMQVEHQAYRLGLRKNKQYIKNTVPPDETDFVDTWKAEWNESMKCSRGHYVVGKILKHLFPYHRVEDEYPLGNLRVDWMIPNLSIACEVHGIQHCKINELFHQTKYDFAKGQENDWKKSEILESLGIGLIVVYYDEDLSINLIQHKIQEII